MIVEKPVGRMMSRLTYRGVEGGRCQLVAIGGSWESDRCETRKRLGRCGGLGAASSEQGAKTVPRNVTS